jgi:hypothetical protein
MSSRWPFEYVLIPRWLALAVTMLVFWAGAANASLKIQASRALDDGDRTSLMLLVHNEGEEAVTIHDLLLGGKPIQEHMTWDPEDPRKIGRDVDWFDIRPRTIDPGKSGIIILGYITRERREPVVALEAITSAGRQDLTTSPPKPQVLQMASVAFDATLDRLTVFVRNDGIQTVQLSGALFNGQPLPAKIKGATLPPGKLAVLELSLPEPAPFGSHGNLLIQSEANGPAALAWFRAYPAEMVTYGFYSNHADPTNLAERNIDAGVTRLEADPGGVAERMDHNDGQLPTEWKERLATRAASFGRNPKAWAWYMHDDSAWGRPRPQSLIDLGRFLREHGSPQRQILCNPADYARYAWVSDTYLHYSYHATHQAPDPAVPPKAHQELHRFTEIIQANEPLPVFFLVDAVGQNARWITPAEQEIASWMMIGRGIRHPGWFLMASLWQQGGNLGGGIDHLETMPWRYQEGAKACLPVWAKIGNIAAQYKALGPYITASAPLGGHLHDNKIEVLPLLCRDDVILTVLLNRQVKSTFPRDFPDGSSAGRFDIVPHRNCNIRLDLPNGIRPVRVFAFDHDRGVRALPFRILREQIEVQVDALDTATILVMSPTPAISKEIETRMRAAFRPAAGAVVRPHSRLHVDQLAQAEEEGRKVEFSLVAGSVEKLAIHWDAPLQNGWIQSRDRAGRMVAFTNLLSGENAATWTLSQPLKIPTPDADLRVFLSDQDGRVTELLLREHEKRSRLRQIARVSGQIESLASSPDAEWILAGADQVHAFTGEGASLWSLDLGENRRQPDAHGPGRNVSQVAIRDDGRFGFARTFRYSPREREYQNSHLILLRPDGQSGERIHCDWRTGAWFAPDGSIAIGEVQHETVVPSRVDPRSGRISPGRLPERPGMHAGEYRLVQRGQGAGASTLLLQGEEEIAELPLPPYPLHQRVAGDGRAVVATTQGVVQATDPNGNILWTERRLGRIDAAVLLEEQNLLAVAYKRYVDRSSWIAVPILELISLRDGSRTAIFEGVAADDFGHYGTPLVLSFARDAGVIFMGDSAGRLYAQPL